MKLGTKEIPALRLGADAALKAYLGGSQVWPLGFDPASLFAQGEQGVWYDPSDLSTLFQDPIGTVPVTGVEQPVGLMLDKSKGLVLGPELVTNGTFDDASNWTTGPSWAITGGKVVKSGVGTDAVFQDIPALVTGRFYRIEVDQTFDVEPTTLLLRVGGGGAVAYNKTLPRVQGRISIVIQADAAATRMSFLFAASISTGTIDNISVRELLGNHASQPTATSRPVLRQDDNGKHYLYFDGVDDILVTPTITPGIDKVQVFVGVRRLRDTSAEIIAETGSGSASQGAFYLAAEPDDTRYGYAGRGNRSGVANDLASISPFPTPDTAILTATQDINANAPAKIRRNGGVWSESNNTDFGSGNFIDHPLYIGSRGGTTLPFNGHVYSMIIRFGSNMPIGTIEQVEALINGKTGAY